MTETDGEDLLLDEPQEGRKVKQRRGRRMRRENGRKREEEEEEREEKDLNLSLHSECKE
jgi:hypothetical protein